MTFKMHIMSKNHFRIREKIQEFILVTHKHFRNTKYIK
jgi:hypothetical protein